MQILKMDFQSQSTPPVVPVMQSDAQSRFIGIALYDGGAPYAAPENAAYTVQYHGPGPNNIGWYDTITLSSGTRKAVTVDSTNKNIITLELAEQALRVNGNVFINLCVVTSTGYMLHTFPILCRVTGAAYIDPVAVRSFFYVTGITSEQWLAYVTACQDAQNRAEAAAATFQTDPTLSISGKAADAAKVGEAVNAEAERAKGVESRIKEDIGYFEFADDCSWIKELYINKEGKDNDVSTVNNVVGGLLFFSSSDKSKFVATADITNAPTGLTEIKQYRGNAVFGYIIADFSKILNSSAGEDIRKAIKNKAYDIDNSPTIYMYIKGLTAQETKNKKLGDKNKTNIDFSECVNSIENPDVMFTNGYVAQNDCVVMSIETVSSVTSISVYVADGKLESSKKWRCYAENIKVVASRRNEDTVDKYIAVVSSYNLKAKKGDEVYVRFLDGTFKYSNDTASSYYAVSKFESLTLMMVNYVVSFNLETISELEEYDEKTNIVGLKICTVGDSLTQGVDVYKHLIAESYPFYLSRKLGSTVLNYGQMGRRTDDWWSNYYDFYIFDESIDVVLIMFGTNGGLTENTLTTDVEPYSAYSDYADTSVGCYCKLIEYIAEKTMNHAQIILITPPYSSYTAAQTELVTKTKPVVEAIAKRYNIPVIDAFSESGANKFNATEFRPNDGCHFNAAGYKRLGGYIASKLYSILY